MGSGSWSTNTYASNATSRLASGTSAFAYTDDIRAGKVATEVHESLDPKLENKAGPLAGKNIRESRDNDEHPTSVAIAVLFDVTGSMLNVPIELQKKLPDLLELLQYKQYVTDPQVLFGAIGDATSDNVPLQIGQFEADNRLEDHLGNIYLEGNGGGQNTESYELGLYFMARHTALDCVEKRDHKGYLFLIGDEHPYPAVKANEVRKVIGDELDENISLEQIMKEVQEKYHTYFIIPAGSSHYDDPSLLSHWRELLGQNVIILDDLSSVAEVIALQVGIAEETIKLDEGITHLEERGVDINTINTVNRALATSSI